MAKARKNNNTEEPIEKQLWKAADKRRKNIDAAEYKAENVFLVPPSARWSFLRTHAKQHTIGKTVDEDDFDFNERFTKLKAEFAEQLKEEARLNALIAENLGKVKVNG